MAHEVSGTHLHSYPPRSPGQRLASYGSASGEGRYTSAYAPPVSTEEVEDPIPASPERSQTGTEDSQRILLRVLDTAFGDDHSGRVLLHAALRSARRASLPTEREAVLDFVRAHLVSSLTVELGPRIVSALLDELADELAKVDDGPPSSRHPVDPVDRPMVTSEVPKSSGVRLRSSVILVDPDRFARANLARTLVTGSCDVAAAESPLDIRSFDGRLDVAIINMDMPDVATVLSALLATEPEVRVVAMTADPASAETLLRAARVRSFRVVPRTTRGTEVLELVKRLSVSA
jgi:CheY-like chemotaxis protein